MSGKRKIAILGGGVGAITTAFALTDYEGWEEKYEIDVYQMGWRLGGKGASGRNRYIANRIEEHGLHIWFGYYQNAFRMMRRVYDECTRLGLTPHSPFRTWHDAFEPQTAATVWENLDGQWKARFMRFPIRPGFPGDDELFQPRAAPPRPWDFLTLILDWMIQECEKLSSDLTSRLPGQKLPAFIEKGLQSLDIHLHEADDIAAQRFPFLHVAHRLAVRLARDPAQQAEAQCNWIAQLVGDFLDKLTEAVQSQLDRSDNLRRTIEVLDLAAATVRGMIADDVFNRGFASIDDYDLREWLKKHGARHWDSPQIKGIYDSSFAYRRGDPDQPNMAAGSTLYQSLRMFLTYRHSVCWRMRAGMGDTIFVPLYLLLRARGVRFHFFHRVKDLALSPDKNQIEAIHIDVQATVKPEVFESNGGYQPLCEVKGLPCWPHEPMYEQLVEGDDLKKYNLESAYTEWHERLPQRTLKRGVDFDDIVLGLSLGPLPYVCRELIQANGKWRNMVEKVETIQTHAVQWWFHKTNQEMGWQNGEPLPDQERALSGAYQQPFDSYSDFTHVLQREEWTAQDNVRNIAYMCHAMSETEPMPEPYTDPGFPKRQQNRVRDYARDYLRHRVRPLWPNAMRSPNSDEIDWNLLVDGSSGAGEQRLDAQFSRANIDPSERYVLSVAGSTKHRLPSGESGFENLYLAGDFTLNDFSAGLVEGAAISGLMASQAICGRPDCVYFSSLDGSPRQDLSAGAREKAGASHITEHLRQRVENIFVGAKKRLLSPPSPPWIVFMTWRDLLFASWRVPVDVVRPKVPPELELDTFDGSAWVSLVPMQVTDSHFRGVVPIPGLESFRELNLRTYVKRNGKGGVYFLSIECPAAVCDWMAYHFFGVPYLRAQIATFNRGDSFHFASERTQKNEPPAAFFGTFRPLGEAFSPSPGSPEAFLVERYCLYFVKNGEVYRGDIHHDDWKLQQAEVQMEVNTIAQAAGLELAAKPDHVVFSLRTDTLIWAPVREHRANSASL